MSPMTIAPCLVGVNAAHEPRPANGVERHAVHLDGNVSPGPTYLDNPIDW
ncbi:MAG: hypothetical protein ACREYF_27110 [Gammaproteobacteria bacterium]